MSFDFKLARSKLFRSFNSIYSKIPRANETVIVSLLKSHCIPVLMYSLEALHLNNTALKSLDHPLVVVFAKIFKTFDKHILNNCMYYLNILPLSYEYLYRRAKFLFKLSRSENCLLSKLSVLFGTQGLVSIYTGLHIHQCDVRNMCAVKHAIWEKIETSNNI